MGRAYIYWDEIPSDLKCPNCGSRTFKVSGSYKAEYEALVHIDGEGDLVQDEIKTFGEEWRVVDGIVCAECEEDLSGKVGL